MPRAELIEVPDSGHGVHRDNPKAFNNIVMDFLTRHAATDTSIHSQRP
jgi:pimeloyl-ACP methyl ester carboxylesterase